MKRVKLTQGYERVVGSCLYSYPTKEIKGDGQMRQRIIKGIVKTLMTLFSIILTVCFIQQTAMQVYAEDGNTAIRFVTDGAAPDIAAGQGGSSDGGVYFGNYP